MNAGSGAPSPPPSRGRALVGSPPPDPWNTLLWRPESRTPHVESLFLELYVPDRRQALWLQFGARTFTVAGRPPVAHVMAARFDAARPARNVALKRRFPPADVHADRRRLDVRMGGCVLEEGRTAGQLEQDGHRIAWDLTFDPSPDVLHHLPWPLLYRLPLPKTKATSPAPDTRFHGWFEVDGEHVAVRRCPGMQGHNWGREHAWRWCWVHASHLAGERPEATESFFEGLTARIRVAGLTSPWLSLLTLRYGNLVLRFDTLRHPFSVKSRSEGLTWEFEAGDARHRVRGRAQTDPERFVGVHYPNPDGRITHCANASTAGFELHVEELVRGRWQRLDTLRAAESAALEVAGPAPQPGVPVLVRE